MHMIGDDRKKNRQKYLRQDAKKYKTDNFDRVGQQILGVFQKQQRIDKFSYISWLQTSEVMSTIIQNAQNKNQKAIHILQIIKYKYDEFFTKLSSSDNIDFIQKVYNKSQVKQIAIQQKKKVLKEFGQKEKSIQSNPKYYLYNLALKIVELKNEDKLNKKQFNKVIKPILIFSQNITNIYDQICYNWVRHKAQEVRNDENNLCCRVLLMHNYQIIMQPNNIQQFKNYKLPIQKDSLIKDALIKTIIAFLNKNGGIIYNGIKIDQYKKTYLNGLAVSIFEIKDFFQCVTKLVKQNIYPKHKQFEEKPNQKTSGFNPIRDVRQINHYISFQYECLVNPQDFTNQRQQQQNKNFYLIKICIKPGHPQHLYHLVNQNKNLQFYIREDRNTTKKPLIDSQQIIVQRTLDYINKINRVSGKEFHPGCRYSSNFQN